MEEKQDKGNLTESVEELRLKLEAMKQMIENNDIEINQPRPRRRIPKNSIITGSFLSFVFAIVLILVISVSVYAFSNLYFAVLKKLPGRNHHDL